MFVFKLSWLPYMMAFAGIYCLTDGQILPGIVLTALGGFWIYIRLTGKKTEKPDQSTGTASKPATTNNAVNSAPKAVPAAPKVVETVQSVPKAQPVEQAKPCKKFCRHCGAKVEPEDVYCVECGKKL